MHSKAIHLSLERGWKFCCGEIRRWARCDHALVYNTTKTGYEVGDMAVFLNENPWKEVCIPHDWNVKQPSDPNCIPSLGFKPRDTGWYYLDFDLPEYPEDACVMLEFEGIMGESVVYVNGVLAARNESGYTGFCFDVSDYLLPGGKNRIVVSVDNTRWEGWWYEGAGIYRPVSLYILPAIHTVHGSSYVRTEKQDGLWHVRVHTEIENATHDHAEAVVESRILAPNGSIVSKITARASIGAFGRTECVAEGCIVAPQLWSIREPVLYAVENRLLFNDECLMTEHISFGFRTIEWTDHGMLLNSIKTPVYGVCCHQDHVGVGIAVTKSLLRYRLAKLKSMGCNAYRCAHHCPSRALLELCDEMGMLVMVENRHFRSSEETLQQLDAMVKLSRNHPSVFLYSLFNEEHWQAEARGRKIADRMLRRVRMLDNTRAVTAAMNGGMLTKENASDVLDVAGINYFIFDYNNYARRRPGHPMLGTENGPLYATRDVYRTEPEKQIYDSYGQTWAHFGQSLPDTIAEVEAAPQVAGLFIWAGFDYRGEPQPFEWPSVFSHWGLMDNCGFEKNTFYMLKSYYCAPGERMLHLLPHWNWQPGEVIRVCVMTNCETVRLFLNGRLLGTKSVKQNRAEWMIPFESGVLRAEAIIDGVTLTDEVRTAGQPAQLEVVDAADETDYDSSILNLRLLDANGIPTPFDEADREVRFIMEHGEIIGVGNGNPNGIQPDIADRTPTFHGRCQVIIRPDAEGRISLTIAADGLPEIRYHRKS